MVKPFRYWFYLRQGYTVYFTFLIAGVNVLTVTYFLAIEKAPFLQEIFPTFAIYVAYAVLLGVPLLIFVGFLHFKKMPAFKSESETIIENAPYNYKAPPGWWTEAIFPYLLISSKILEKQSQNEKLSVEEINDLHKVQKNLVHLLKGGYVGDKKRKLAFDLDKIEK